jgi:hypothetical protein
MLEEDPIPFRLYSGQINAYAADPRWHTLRRGIGYPDTVTEANMRQRLRQAASVRGFSVRTLTGPDFIRFRFIKGRDLWWQP